MTKLRGIFLCITLYKSMPANDTKYILRMSKMLYAIEYLGRYCSSCNLDGFKKPWVMDFHHKANKSYDVKNKIYGGRFSDHKRELDKCELLCSNCHRDHHSRNDYENKYDLIVKKLKELKENGNMLVSKKLTKDEKSKILKLIHDGKTMKEVSEISNISYERIKYLIKTNGLKPTRGGKSIIPGSIIIKLLNQRFSIRGIAGKTEISRETIRKWISKNTIVSEINGVIIYKRS